MESRSFFLWLKWLAILGTSEKNIYPLGNTQGLPRVCNTENSHTEVVFRRWIQYESTPKTHGKHKDKSALRRITEDF